MRSQVIGKHQSRLSRRGTVGEIRRGEDEEKVLVTEQRRKFTDLGLDLGKRQEQVADCASALAMTDKADKKVEM